jgi:peptide-methionine (S)-S-oxide reductase
MEKATFASGCFWCSEAIFKRLKGVKKVVSGYSGGSIDNPTYEQVSTGSTGYAESIQIEFDPNLITYDKLLEIFWRTHNPTTLNQQGNDIGSQYRSVIFYHDQKQKKLALDSKKIIEEYNLYKDKIVTEIIPYINFYPAESYHQDFYDKNKDYPYCTYTILPKIEKLTKDFDDELKENYKTYET